MKTTKKKKNNLIFNIKNSIKYQIQKGDIIYLSFAGIIKSFDPRDIYVYNIPTLKNSIEAFNHLNFEYKIDIENTSLDILEKDKEENYKIKDIVEKLYQKLFARFNDMIACRYEKDKNPSEEEKNLYYAIFKAFNRLIRLMDETIPKYETLLNLYEARKDNILNELKITTDSLTKHNDTPQGEGDFSGDNYTSDTNKLHSEMKREDSLIARLREIDEAFKNCFEDWISEFEKCFIEDINL